MLLQSYYISINSRPTSKFNLNIKLYETIGILFAIIDYIYKKK
jgi:hypothetical protein